jgi:hypothetical protein
MDPEADPTAVSSKGTIVRKAGIGLSRDEGPLRHISDVAIASGICVSMGYRRGKPPSLGVTSILLLRCFATLVPGTAMPDFTGIRDAFLRMSA